MQVVPEKECTLVYIPTFLIGEDTKNIQLTQCNNIDNLRYHWMYSATAYNHSYSDTGLFCIHASAPPNHLRDMVEVIVKELVGMANNITDQELRVRSLSSFVTYAIIFFSCL